MQNLFFRIEMAKNEICARFSSAIDFVRTSAVLENHDVPRARHFAILLRGRKFFAKIFCNAINTNEATRGPIFTRALDCIADRSIHAEARAVFRTMAKDKANSKRARKKLMRQSVTAADGVLVCRMSPAGKLCYSLPCRKCVEVMQRFKIKFVVFSTGDESRPWEKISIEKLCSDERVMPVRALR